MLCPGATPPKLWILEKELAGTTTPITVASADMSQLVGDSVDADDFDESASTILGGWYDDAADIEPTTDTLEERHQAVVNRLRSMFADFRNL